MARDRKRTKQVEEMVKRANNIFKEQGVKDPYGDSLFRFMDSFLLDMRMYEGYNFYKIGENDKLYLAGSAKPEEYDCIQLY